MGVRITTEVEVRSVSRNPTGYDNYDGVEKKVIADMQAEDWRLVAVTPEFSEENRALSHTGNRLYFERRRVIVGD